MKLKLKLNYLLFVFVLSMVFSFQSCQKDDGVIEEIKQESEILRVEQIPYNSVKRSHKHYIRQLNTTSIINKNNQDNDTSLSVVVDTSNVTHVTYDSYSSYTFPVASIDTETTLKNVLISENPDGTSSYFLVSYELNTTLDQIDMSNVENHILSRTAINIEVSDLSYNIQKRSGGDCWSVDEYTEHYCEDANGNTIRDNGQLGNGCVRNWHTETVTVLTIDVGCSGGGGNTSGPNTGAPGDDSGVPDPSGSGQGGIPSGSGVTKPTVKCKQSTGLGGSDGCGSTIDTIERDNLFQVLSPYLNQQQANWIYYSADIRIVTALNDFIESSSIYNEQDNINASILLIDFYKEKGWKELLREAIAEGITSTAELMHLAYKKLSQIVEQYPSSIGYINTVIDELRDIAEESFDTNPQTLTWEDLFGIWLFELGIYNEVSGTDTIEFDGDDVTTQLLTQEEGVGQARQIALDNISNNDIDETVTHTWVYGQDEFYDGISSGNLVTAFLGSYITTIVITENADGSHTLDYTITNTSGWDSATRFRIDNDGDGNHDGIFQNTERDDSSTINLGGNINQIWNWQEIIN